MTEPLFFARPQGLTAQEIAALTGAVAAAGRRARPPHQRHRGARSRHPERSRVPAKPEICRASRRPAPASASPPSALPASAPADVAVLVHAGALSGVRRGRRRSCFPARCGHPRCSRRAACRRARWCIRRRGSSSGVTIDPAAVIGPRAEIGAGTVIAAGAVIGPEVRIGRDCTIGAGATIVHALIGDRVIIHAGARIGQDGFGYLPGADGARQGAPGRPGHHSGRRGDRRQHDDRSRLRSATP